MRRLMLVAVMLMAATVAQAQIVNPSAVAWDHVDFASAAHYDGGYFALPVTVANTCDLLAVPAPSPVMTDNLGKPATTTGVGMSALLVARPIGCYVMRLRVLDASGLYSDWSVASDPFLRRPSTPTKPVPR